MNRQVILIMTDTTRKDMLGCYGNPEMKTPNLDRMAEEGLRFENAYSCQPVCGPARSAIFTGTFPHSNGVYTNCVPMGANVKTLGERLTDNGVHCGYIGKWHLDGGDYFGFGVCPPGWDKDYWYDMKCYLNELSEEDRVRSRKSETAYEEGFSEEFTYAHRCADRALRFLEEHEGEDYFLTLSLDEPHGPCLCPAPYNTMYEGFRFPDTPEFDDDLQDKPFYQRLWSGKDREKAGSEINVPSKQLALFLGCNSFADYEIGRVLDRIKEKAPDALVIYTSDHGDMLGAHKLQMKNAAIYKEVANIPLIMKGGIFGAGEEEGAQGVRKGVDISPASHIDLAPTIMEYFGLPIPKLLEGKSMLTELQDENARTNDVVFTEFTRYEIDHDGFGGLQMMRACTTERYRFALHLADSDELYDTETDPYEVKNLINDAEYKEVRNRLHDAVLEHMNATRDPFRGYQWAARPWRPEIKEKWENDGYTRQRENEEYEPRQLDYDTGLPMVNAVRKKETNDVKGKK